MGFIQTFRQELLTFIQSINWISPVALTLTLKQRAFNRSMDEIQASVTIRHFMNRLNRSIFGNASKRYQKGLQVVPVIEHGVDKRYHIHAIIDRPGRLEPLDFELKVREAWQDTDFGYYHIHMEPVRDDGWAHYITKFSQKPDYDLSINWENVRKN
jgi:hypothetical protein